MPLQMFTNLNIGDKDIIDIAATECDRGEGVDGETAINQLRARLHQSNTL